MLSSRLLEEVVLAVATLPPSSVKNIAQTLESADVLSVNLRSHVQSCLALPQERLIMTSLMTEWVQDPSAPSPSLISAALLGALHTRSAMERATRTELVWTGPTSGISFRRTDQALLQVIQAAKRELLLVTFAAYRVPLLHDAIRHSIDRGVTVSFLGESAEESGGKVSFDAAQAFGGISHHIRFYVWPREKREQDVSGHSGALHAKCALADEDVLLVSSANF